MSGSCSTPQLAVREQAEHAQRHHHHGGEDRVVDRDAGDPHGGASPFRSLRARRRRRLSARRRRRRADAVGAARCATTLAGAPSFRLSKRAASTCASGVRPCSTSTRPRAASRPAGDDDAAHQRRRSRSPRRSPAPTPGRPRSSAASAAAAASASSTRACAYWPARKRSSRLSSTTTTPIARVPASAAGAMRAMRPGTGVALRPRPAPRPAWPARSSETSCVPTRAGQLERRQVDDRSAAAARR